MKEFRNCAVLASGQLKGSEDHEG